MDAELDQKLRAADAKSNLQDWEYPLGFDLEAYKCLLDKIKKCAAEIETSLGLTVDVHHGQDSTFAAEILLAMGAWKYGMRFSCFDHLFTTWGWQPQESHTLFDPQPSETLKFAIQIAQDHGFFYVEETSLQNAIYDGVLPIPEGYRFTWWDRFFDYL
ncbi:hypothetical protein [Deinococcus roseus]|uniref:Uncharacterized protein n=1 Tax=Deinococcus roseus TaxID=392414 RepID=A0ABQ2CVZ7_9DEIO|nr:hypothetical protein [Deinococcus roseus]GGJ26264.1 hypothetical protein GCM10008938_10520 [Deinococcus roseus]